MLDYSLAVTFKNHKYGDFICNYSIIDGEIVLFNNDKEFARIPYTNENEKDVLNIMKKQVKIMSLLKDTIINTIIDEENKKKFFILSSLLTLGGALILLSKKHFNAGIAFTITAIIEDIFAVFQNIRSNKHFEMLDDIEKNELFLEFETEINRYIKNVKDLEVYDEIEKLTINDIHYFTYEEVENLVESARDHQNSTI